MSAQYEELQEKEKSIKKIVENMGHWCIEEDTKMANTYMKKKLISIRKNEILNPFHRQN